MKLNLKETILKFKDSKSSWMIVLLVGLLLAVVAIPVGTEDTEVAKVQETENSVESIDGTLEERLTAALSQVEGIGRVSVMITYKAGKEKVVEKDTTTSETTAESTVYGRDENGNEVPYVKKELEAEVQGVVVVADGGDKPVIQAQITEAAQVLFGIEAHKIKVMKKSQGGED